MHCRQQARRRAACAKGSARPRAVCRHRAPLCPVPPAACVLLPVYQKLRKCASPAPQALFPAAGAVFPMDDAPMACAVRGPWRRPLPALFPSANAFPVRRCCPNGPRYSPPAAPLAAAGTFARPCRCPPLAPRPACRQRRPIGPRAWGPGPCIACRAGKNIPIVMIILFVYPFPFPHRPTRWRAAPPARRRAKKRPTPKAWGILKKRKITR